MIYMFFGNLQTSTFLVWYSLGAVFRFWVIYCTFGMIFQKWTLNLKKKMGCSINILVTDIAVLLDRPGAQMVASRPVVCTDAAVGGPSGHLRKPIFRTTVL